MPNILYTTGVPNPPNLPAVDVGSMQVNTNSINQWVDVDHWGFNTGGATNNLGGYHRQVSMPNQAAPGIPAGTDGVLFADDAGGNSWPIWQNTLGSFQITGSDSPNNPSGKLANGWSFLSGGFIYQWGVIDLASVPVYTTTILTPVLFATANINFPVSCISVQATLIPSPGPIPAQPNAVGSISIGPISNTGFSFLGFNGNYIGFYWTAIGF